MTQARRIKLAHRLNGEPILLLGNAFSPMNYRDNHYPFRQDSSFLYFTGLNYADLALLIADGKTTLFGKTPHPDDLVWTGQLPSLGQIAEKAGMDSAADIQSLASTLKNYPHVHYLKPYRADNLLLLSEVLQRLPRDIPLGFSPELSRAVVAMREIKSESEIQSIESALEVTAKAHVLAMQTTRPHLLEQHIVAEMDKVVSAAGRRWAYPVIFSKRGEILHNTSHDLPLKAGDIVVNDSGSDSLDFYASDITRTIPVSGAFDAQQAALYDLICQSQNEAAEFAQIGTPFIEVHKHACTTLAVGLKELGLMKGDPVEAGEAGAHALFFPCGLGHMLGLDVHDMEDIGEEFVGYGDGSKRSSQFGLKYLRLAKPLKENFVLTIEPGLYFNPTLIEMWKADRKHEAFLNYREIQKWADMGGYRVEDNYLVTDKGMRPLGPPIPKLRSEVENCVIKGQV